MSNTNNTTQTFKSISTLFSAVKKRVEKCENDEIALSFESKHELSFDTFFAEFIAKNGENKHINDISSDYGKLVYIAQKMGNKDAKKVLRELVLLKKDNEISNLLDIEQFKNLAPFSLNEKNELVCNLQTASQIYSYINLCFGNSQSIKTLVAKSPLKVLNLSDKLSFENSLQNCPNIGAKLIEFAQSYNLATNFLFNSDLEKSDELNIGDNIAVSTPNSNAIAFCAIVENLEPIRVNTHKLDKSFKLAFNDENREANQKFASYSMPLDICDNFKKVELSQVEQILNFDLNPFE